MSERSASGSSSSSYADSGDELRLAEAVLTAAALEGEEREAYLRELEVGEPTLAIEARRRLAAAAGLTDSFLDTPAADLLALPMPPPGRSSQDAESLPPSAGGLLGARYELLDELGRGGMGRVLLAHDHQLGRRVALKFLGHEDPMILRLFLREARSQARIEHPNVLEIYDSGELDGEPFIAMRYIPGGTLADRAPGLSLEQKVFLLAQVADGLHAAHRRGLLHGDVKPSNVLVEDTADGELRALVADFGLAAELEEPAIPRGSPRPAALGGRSTVAGSPHFIAPERLRGSATVDRRSDVYSLGVTLYRTLVGALPHEGRGTLEVLRHTAEGEVPSPKVHAPELPAELEAIILRCLAREPAERYPSARAVAAELRRYLDGEVVEAHATGLAYRLTRWVLRNRLLASISLAALVGLLLASAAVAVFAWRADADRQRAELRHEQAEELIHFMLFDLREKLESVGRLDVLAAADGAATEYFAAVPATELSETELLRRSRLLYQIGDVRIRQGDVTGAAAPMAESLQLARRLAELRPDDPERLFELGQAHFWVGFVAWRRGELARAREAFEDYLGVSRRLVERDPTNLDWRRELSHASSNLGSLLEAEGDLEGAVGQFRTVLVIDEELVEANPTPEARFELAAAHNTLGVVLQVLDRLEEAEHHLRADLELRRELLALDPASPRAQAFLGTSSSYLGMLLLARGDLDSAAESFRAMRDVFTRLAAHDPDNSDWLLQLAWSQIQIGRVACARGELEMAEAAWRDARRWIDEQLARDETPTNWRRTRAIALYHLAIFQATQGEASALDTARRAVEALEALGPEQLADRRTERWLAWSTKLLAALDGEPPSGFTPAQAAHYCRAEEQSFSMSSSGGASR